MYCSIPETWKCWFQIQKCRFLSAQLSIFCWSPAFCQGSQCFGRQLYGHTNWNCTNEAWMKLCCIPTRIWRINFSMPDSVIWRLQNMPHAYLQEASRTLLTRVLHHDAIQQVQWSSHLLSWYYMAPAALLGLQEKSSPHTPNIWPASYSAINEYRVPARTSFSGAACHRCFEVLQWTYGQLQTLIRLCTADFVLWFITGNSECAHNHDDVLNVYGAQWLRWLTCQWRQRQRQTICSYANLENTN